MTMLKFFAAILFTGGLGVFMNTDTTVDDYSEYGIYLMDVSSSETLKARYVDLHEELDQISEIQVREKDETLVYVSIGSKNGIKATATVSYPKNKVENFFLPPPCYCNDNGLMKFVKGNRIDCIPCAQDD